MNITDLDDKTIRASQEQSVRMKIIDEAAKILAISKRPFFRAGLQRHVKCMKKDILVSALLYKSNLTFLYFIGSRFECYDISYGTFPTFSASNFFGNCFFNLAE
jgi:cysteinyl-tRNA synthetase